VENFDELTYHLLDIILVHCQNTKGPIPGTGGAAATNGGGMGAATPMRQGLGMPGGQQKGAPLKAENTNMDDAVMEAYMQVSISFRSVVLLSFVSILSCSFLLHLPILALTITPHLVSDSMRSLSCILLLS
jgi:hypothetical protein